MVHAIPFGKRQKLWAVIIGDAFFPLFLVCSVNLDTFCSGSYSHHAKLYGWFCVNGNVPEFFSYSDDVSKKLFFKDREKLSKLKWVTCNDHDKINL